MMISYCKNLTGCMRSASGFLLLCMYISGWASAATYMDERDPGKHALIIGNSTYDSLSEIPSAHTDAEKAKALFEMMGFKVTAISNLRSVRQFEDDVLPTFRRHIEPGDLVVFYFSGHGFGYGPHNFLAPADIKLDIKDKEVSTAAIAVEGVQDYLERRNPGLVLMLIDACRTVGGFVVRSEAGKNLVEKGFSDPPTRSRGINSIVGYAARAGYIAVGTSEPSAMSLFTASLVKHLARAGLEFGSLFKDVSSDVRLASDEQQHPGLYVWSDTDLYLNPTEPILAQQREAWEAALASGRRPAIQRFNYRNSVSRHAAAARRWLAENPDDGLVDRYSFVSPEAVERAWRPGEKRQAIAPLPTGFGFERALAPSSAVRVAAFSDKALGLVSSGAKAASVGSPKSYDALMAHGTLVASKSLPAKAAPKASAKTLGVIEPGTRILLRGFEMSETGTTWLVGQTLGENNKLFIPWPTSMATHPVPVELGQSLVEVLVNAPADGLKDIVDGKAIFDALAQLRMQGKTVTWVSLAIAPSKDRSEYEARQSRLVHATYILGKAKVDGRRISAVTSASDLHGDAVRLRIFGY